MNELKNNYNILDDEVAGRIYMLKSQMEIINGRTLSYNEILAFLKSAMYFDEMQIWLVRSKNDGKILSLTDKLKKLFEFKTNEELLEIYNNDVIKLTLK